MTNTSRFGTMMLYGLANAETLPAIKMDSETTKEFMIENNLKEKLIIGGRLEMGRLFSKQTEKISVLIAFMALF